MLLYQHGINPIAPIHSPFTANVPLLQCHLRQFCYACVCNFCSWHWREKKMVEVPSRITLNHRKFSTQLLKCNRAYSNVRIKTAHHGSCQRYALRGFSETHCYLPALQQMHLSIQWHSTVKITLCISASYTASPLRLLKVYFSLLGNSRSFLKFFQFYITEITSPKENPESNSLFMQATGLQRQFQEIKFPAGWIFKT